MHRILADEQEKYGKVMRIGPNELIVYDPETILRMSNVRSQYGRSDWHASIKFDPYGNTVLSEPDTAKHDERKALIAGGYAGKGGVKLEQKVDHQLAILVDILRKNYAQKSNRKALDFGQLVRYFQIDLITFAGYSETWGDLVTETDQFDFISITDSISPFMALNAMIPLLRAVFFSNFFLRLFGPKTTDKKGMGKLLG